MIFVASELKILAHGSSTCETGPPFGTPMTTLSITICILTLSKVPIYHSLISNVHVIGWCIVCINPSEATHDLVKLRKFNDKGIISLRQTFPIGSAIVI